MVTFTADVLVFLKSIAAGFIMCIPIGPISIIILRKTVNTGPVSAIPSAYGSMLADSFYSIVAGFGIVTITQFFSQYQKYLQLTAAVVLLLVAIKILKTKPKQLMRYSRSTTDAIADFVLGFFIVLLNPIVLFIMTNILTTLNVQTMVHSIQFGLAVTSGIVIGEGLWWTAFISTAHYATKRIGTHAPITINTFAGLVLLILSTLFIIKIAVY